MVRWLALLLTTAFFAVGCDRPVDGNSTKITIQAPAAFGKVGALSLPGDRKACYGVIVTAPDITGSPATACSPRKGILAGFVQSGDPIEAVVKRGSDRRIDLYLLLKAAGDNTACPSMTAHFAPAQFTNIYHLGTAANLSFSREVEEVVINATFPGLSNHVAAQLSMPATCIAAGANTNPVGFRVTSAQGTATGTGLVLKARVGTVPESKVLTGTGIQLKVK